MEFVLDGLNSMADLNPDGEQPSRLLLCRLESPFTKPNRDSATRAGLLLAFAIGDFANIGTAEDYEQHAFLVADIAEAFH